MMGLGLKLNSRSSREGKVAVELVCHHPVTSQEKVKKNLRLKRNLVHLNRLRTSLTSHEKETEEVSIKRRWEEIDGKGPHQEGQYLMGDVAVKWKDEWSAGWGIWERRKWGKG